jgi:hemerythrin-like domain-containing protein
MRHNRRVLRDPNLIPLSHQHQHALALCVRIARAPIRDDSERRAWQEEIAQHFSQEIRHHFAAEEAVLFPRARHHAELDPLVDSLVEEHRRLQMDFEQAQALMLSAEQLRDFASRLSAHIRKEERQLFEDVQKRLSGSELKELGARLADALKTAESSCILPNTRTRLRPRRES